METNVIVLTPTMMSELILAPYNVESIDELFTLTTMAGEAYVVAAKESLKDAPFFTQVDARPEWLLECILNGEKDADGNWVVDIPLVEASSLFLNQSWEALVGVHIYLSPKFIYHDGQTIMRQPEQRFMKFAVLPAINPYGVDPNNPTVSTTDYKIIEYEARRKGVRMPLPLHPLKIAQLKREVQRTVFQETALAEKGEYQISRNY